MDIITFFGRIYLINDYKIFILILFILLFSIETLFLKQNKFNISFQKLSPLINGDTIISNKHNINSTINNFTLELNDSCFQTENKLYWDNNKNLGIEKLREDIKNSKSTKISYEKKVDFYRSENPKISIIITVYNQGNYIKTSYAYIQKQELKDIEIIFVDDASSDNSSLIIKELMEFDKKIIYLKNSINKRQFYSINLGVIYSKGEYILSIDPDDLILNNILLKAYKTAKYYNLEILQFYMLNNMTLWTSVKYKSGIICSNKNIRNIFYYGGTRNLPDKLIKRSIFIKSIYFMKRELYNLDYHIHTDDTIFFGLIHFVNSYGFLEEIGYFYNQDPKRKPFIKKDNSIIINEKFRSLFNIMKYFIIQSDNSTIEKNNIPYKYFQNYLKYFEKVINYINKDFEFYIEVLNIYIDCPFFSIEKKNEINNFKKKILIRQFLMNNTKVKY